MRRRKAALVTTTEGRAALLLLLLLLLAAVPSTAAQDAEYSCERIDAVPPEKRCEFVSTKCDSGARVPFMPWYYCHVHSAGVLARCAYLALLALLLPLLFTLLGDTAEMYFSPTMALVSQSIPKMRPRFAGVTFVAMGNGAPDLSANISAIRNGSVQLSAGAFTGAAMFVQCIVASEVIRISRGAPCRGATLRDLSTYFVSLVAVALAFASGKITRWFIAGALLVYAAYAAWVFGGDEWHAAGRPRLSWAEARDLLLRRSRSDAAAAGPTWAPVEDGCRGGSVGGGGADGGAGGAAAPLLSGVPDGGGSAAAAPRHKPRALLGAAAYRAAVWADLSDDRSFLDEARGRRGTRSRATRDGGARGELEMGAAENGGGGGGGNSGSTESSPRAGGADYEPPDWEAVAGSGARQSAQHPAAAPPVHSSKGSSDGGGAHTHAPTPPPQPDSEYASGPGGGGDSSGRGGEVGQSDNAWQRTYRIVQRELTMGGSEEWDALSGARALHRRLTFPPLLPFYGALRLTVPMVDPVVYSQPWLVASMACAPLGAAAYFGVGSASALLALLAVGAALATATHVLTRDEQELPDMDLGTGFAFAPAVFSLSAFFMGVLWIDALASEVVGILSLVANLASLPSSLVGLTLLAWGGSLGDLFGNSALARRGHASTALTACFAGPLFIMLVSLALGFWSHFAQEHVTSMAVVLTPDVALGVVFLLMYNVAVAAVGLANGFRLPERFYIFSRAWYCLYLGLACGMGLLGVAQA